MLYSGPTACIDLNTIQNNLSYIYQHALCKFYAVVKGNAYGHGLIEISRFLAKQKKMVLGLAVGRLEEALLLRKNEINSKILIMDGFIDDAAYKLIRSNNFKVVTHNFFQLKKVISSDKIFGKSIWINIDAGLNQLGFNVLDLPHILALLKKNKIRQKSIKLFFHLPKASNLADIYTQNQLNFIRDIKNKYAIACSFVASGSVFIKEYQPFQLPRVGSSLFGINPLPSSAINFDKINQNLKTCMSLKAPILTVRRIRSGDAVGYGHAWKASSETQIAVVGLGYGDGYPREGACGAPVLIRDRLFNVVGKISMDKLTVAIPDLDFQLTEGEMVTFWGPNLSINHIARHFKISAVELLTRLNSRVIYQYLNKRRLSSKAS